MADEYAPCKLVTYAEEFGDPRYGLIFSEFESTEEFFEDKGLMGGGPTWHGVVESLLRKHDPAKLDSLAFDPESSMFCVRSSDLKALATVANWIKKALADSAVLEEAIENADPSIIE